MEELRCGPYVNLARARLSIGTLGGGNHFIEVDRAENGDMYIVVHSGSRHLSTEVAEYYQNQGRFALWQGADYQIAEMIKGMRKEGHEREIQGAIQELRKEYTVDIPKALAYVEGRLFDDYIHDMRLTQYFAMLNRKAMTDVIINGMDFHPVEEFTTIHNYIDTDKMILRKGAVSAEKGEKLLIPINMRDGSLICVGRGNDDWNCSAPHGAGRLMSRTAAKRNLSMEEYANEMKGIFSSCICKDTLDEAPMAYKSMNDILNQIGPTAEVIDIIKPVYNFKATE